MRGGKRNSRRTDSSCTHGGDPGAPLPKQTPLQLLQWAAQRCYCPASWPRTWVTPGSGASACGSTRLPSLHPSRKRNQKRTMIRSLHFALRLPGSKSSPTVQGRFFQDKSLNHFPVSSSMRWDKTGQTCLC